MPSQIASKSRRSCLVVQTNVRGLDWKCCSTARAAARLSITRSSAIERVVLSAPTSLKSRSNLRKGISFDAGLVQIEGKSTSSTWIPGDFSQFGHPGVLRRGQGAKTEYLGCRQLHRSDEY